MLSLAMSDFKHKNRRHPIFLSEWRKRLTSFNQKAMAEALDMPQSNYSYIESGARRANLDQLMAISEFLGLEPGQLFKSPDDPFNEVIDLYKQIPEADRETATELLRAFVQKKLKST